MTATDIRVDISATFALPGGVHLAATVFVPDPMLTPRVVIFAVPGGGYNRAYYDLRFAGHDGYSQADHHVAHGAILIAIDHLGVGESSIPDLSTMSIADMADALAAAVTLLSDRLADGSLVEELPPQQHLRRIGIGQSMGGCVTIVAQARHNCWDAIGILGFSARQVVLPQPDATAEARNHQRHRDAIGADGKPVRGAIALEGLRWPFFWEDTPDALIDEDFAGGYPIRESAPVFGSMTMPHCAVTMLNPAIVGAEAAAITAPVFLAFGERDVSASPHDEPAAYPASGDIMLTIIPRMAHMHNFAGSRHLLWDRLLAWATGLPAVRQAERVSSS